MQRADAAALAAVAAVDAVAVVAAVATVVVDVITVVAANTDAGPTGASGGGHEQVFTFAHGKDSTLSIATHARFNAAHSAVACRPAW